MDSANVKKFAEQEKRLQKYEQKMRDLIEAYKALSKEKETLEMTIKSLVENSDKSRENKCDETDLEKALNQVAIVTNAIATLSDEKRRMERNYQEDKRVTRGEYETNLAAMRTEMNSQAIIIRELNSQLNELRSESNRARAGVSEEVQSLGKDNQELLERINETERQIDEQKLIINCLNNDCERYRSIRSDLEHEIATLKNNCESRVALLEGTITDLSKNFGKMEQQHHLDQETINKLLDKPKTDHRDNSSRRETQSDTPDILQFPQFDSELLSGEASVSVIVERISQLRSQLLKLDPSFDLSSLSPQHLSSLSAKCCHINSDVDRECCNQQLKEQLESSQLTVHNLQMMIQMHSSSGGLSSSIQQREIDKLSGELSNTKSKMCQLQDELSSLDLSAAKNVKDLKEKFLKTEWEHKQELLKLQQTHNQTVLELQSELTKHRNRTISLLAEKDNEIKGIQKLLQLNKTHDRIICDQTNTDEEDENPEHGALPNISSCPLYQCCEVKARMDQELRKLRRKKRELVLQIHKLESDMEYARSDWSSEVNELTNKLRRAESINKLSSNINMEYLRNVLIRFLNTSDPSCRCLMANAIAKVLQFSPEELSTLQTNNWK